MLLRGFDWRRALTSVGGWALAWLSAFALAGSAIVGDSRSSSALRADGANIRFLIDDSKVEWWGPSSGDWLAGYGDFYAYGFQGLRDWIRRRWGTCEVRTEPLSRDTLQSSDVLVVKVPEREYAAGEVAAVRDWVHAGGHVLVLGDHTNLLGSSAALNGLLREFGMEFRFDHVTRRGGGGIVDATCYGPGQKWILPAAIMSACSVRGDGRTVVAVLDAWSVPWDPEGRSGFSQSVARTGTIAGDFAVGMCKRHGKGAVCAFGDTTLFSGFALHKANRKELFAHLVDCLYQDEGEAWPGLAARMLLIGLGASGVYVLWRLLQDGRYVVPGLIAVIACVGGYWACVVPWVGDVDQARPVGEPCNAWRVRGIGRNVYVPESIGSRSVESRHSYDGLVYALVRSGLPVECRDSGIRAGDSVWCIATEGCKATQIGPWLRDGRKVCIWADGVEIMERLRTEFLAAGWTPHQDERYATVGARGDVGLYAFSRPGQLVFLAGGVRAANDEVVVHPMSVPTWQQQAFIEAVGRVAKLCWSEWGFQ